MVENAADIKFHSDAMGKEVTIKEYLKEMLKKLWLEGESFSGKRPFGNSGWEYDLYQPLIKQGFVKGDLDDHGFIDHLDSAGEIACNRIILNIIEEL